MNIFDLLQGADCERPLLAEELKRCLYQAGVKQADIAKWINRSQMSVSTYLKRGDPEWYVIIFNEACKRGYGDAIRQAAASRAAELNTERLMAKMNYAIRKELEK